MRSLLCVAILLVVSVAWADPTPPPAPGSSFTWIDEFAEPETCTGMGTADVHREISWVLNLRFYKPDGSFEDIELFWDGQMWRNPSNGMALIQQVVDGEDVWVLYEPDGAGGLRAIRILRNNP